MDNNVFFVVYAFLFVTRGADGAEGRQPRNVQGVRAGAPGGRKMVTVSILHQVKMEIVQLISRDFSLISMS